MSLLWKGIRNSLVRRLLFPKFQNRRNFFRIIPSWENGVKLGFGKYIDTVEPGMRLNIPFYHRIYKVNMADRVQDMSKQSLISKDNVTFYIDSSIQYRVIDAKKAIICVTDLDSMLLDRCQMALRTILSRLEINEILHDLSDTSNKIKESLEFLEEQWGVEISSVQLKDISFDETMRRAMATKAEADRNAEAKIINANADIKTAQIYSEAAKIYAEDPITLRLREFQLWQSVSKNPNNTMYVVPSNILDFFKKK